VIEFTFRLATKNEEAKKNPKARTHKEMRRNYYG
jgi:hypothetical protein